MNATSERKSITPLDILDEPETNIQSMNLEQIKRKVEKIDCSTFDNTRMFNPRKQRSCHRRPEPISEECRKKESSKNSREYTKRNRDEIAMIKLLLLTLIDIKLRLRILVAEVQKNEVETRLRAICDDIEEFLSRKSQIKSFGKRFFNIPDPDNFLVEYRRKADYAMEYKFETEESLQHVDQLEELQKQLRELTSLKDNLSSAKDKTNFASSKSRLNQRVIRAQLKSDCWICWIEINTLIGRGERLQLALDELKQDVWTNIFKPYQTLFKLCNPTDISERMVLFCEPYTEVNGIFQWIPGSKAMKKEKIEEPEYMEVSNIEEPNEKSESLRPLITPPTSLSFPFGVPMFIPGSTLSSPASSLNTLASPSEIPKEFFHNHMDNNSNTLPAPSDNGTKRHIPTTSVFGPPINLNIPSIPSTSLSNFSFLLNPNTPRILEAVEQQKLLQRMLNQAFQNAQQQQQRQYQS